MTRIVQKRPHSWWNVAAKFAGADNTDVRDVQQRILQLIGLEDRLLFSATPVSSEMIKGEPPDEVDEQPVSVAEADQPQQQQDPDGQDSFGSSTNLEQSTDLVPSDEFILQWDPHHQSGSSGDSVIRHELVIVDTSTQDYQTLLDDLLASADDDRQFEVLLLDGSRDGVEQISDALSNYSELDALHLVTHGTAGHLKLGNTWLDADQLAGYASDIAGWSDALSADADLMIYGCDLAATVDGRLLIESLSALADCDVAASTDATGHASLGGDWNLEYAWGVVDTDVAFSADVRHEWLGLLSVETVRDEFNSVSYSSNDGTVTWTTDWQETFESNGPAAGSVTVGTELGEQGIVITQQDNGILREVDLSSATIAALSFDYAVISYDDSAEYVAIEISGDGGANWDELDRFEGPLDHTSLQSTSYDITAYAASNTQIRFTTGPSNDGGDCFIVDNVEIIYTTDGSLVVDTAADVVDGDTSSVASLLGNRGADGYISLREAILATNADSGIPDTIILDAATYTLSIAGSNEDLGATGDLDIRDDLTIIGVGRSTIIDANGIDRVFQVAPGVSLTVDGVVMTHGDATGDLGGAILVDAQTTSLTLIDSAITDSVAQNAGAIFSTGTVLLERVTLSGNTATTLGGAITSGNNSSLTLTNVTLSGNSAPNGAAIWTNETIDITNSTIAFNLGIGAAIHGQGSGMANLKNSIVSNNTGGNSNKLLTSLGYNIEDGSTAFTAVAGDLQNTDPQLDATLRDNGGSTDTHALETTSLAIDPAGLTGAPTTDQRGVVRDALADIGAYEFVSGANSPPTVSLTNVVSSLPEDADTSIAIKIADIVISDDGNGTNALSISGVDAASFEIVGTELRLRAGTSLDYETKISYDVTVEVDDLALGGAPDDTAAHSLSITDSNEAPTVALTNVVPSLAEDADTSSAIKIADIVITDDALGTNNLTLAGADAASFEIVGTELRLRAGTSLDYETKISYDVTVEVDDSGVVGAPDDTAAHSLSITDSNEAPTVALTNVVPSLAEDADTSSAIKIADILITDDALGTNNLTLAGADAGSFEIVGTELRLRAGTSLDYETKISYDVTVEVDDSGVVGAPDDTAAHSLSITDSNEAPTVALTNVVPSLAEDADTSSAIKIADIVITDDALGTNNLTLAGADAGSFEIVGTELRLRAGTSLDYETKTSYDVTVEVDDSGVVGAPDDTAAHSLSITDSNEVPTVALTNVVPSLAEDADTSSAIKIADIVITDDALGTNNLTLAGADAASFEVVGTELRLRAGTVLDHLAKPSYDVTVEVDDPAITGTPDDSATSTLSITEVNDPPTISLANVLPTLSEDANTSSAIKIADVVVTDDTVGTNNVTLAGADAASFEIVGMELRLRAGVSLDFETKASFSVTVRVDDPAVGGTPDDAAMHTLAITNANDAPVAGDDSVVTTQGDSIQVSAAMLLSNDTDIDLDTLQLVAITQPLHGTILVATSSSLTYTPDENFFGVDSFTYTVADSKGARDTATVTVSVDPLGAAPPVAATDLAEPAIEAEEDNDEEEGDDTTELMPQPHYQSTREENPRAFPRRMQASSQASMLEPTVASITTPRGVTETLVATNLFFQRSDVFESVTDLHNVLPAHIHNLAYIYDAGGFLSDLDTSTNEILVEYPVQQWVAGTAVFASAGMSVGYVMWTIRGGYLLASMLSSVPAWALVDPLPVLEFLDDSERSGGEDRDDDDSLDSIIDEAISHRSSNQDQSVKVCVS